VRREKNVPILPVLTALALAALGLGFVREGAAVAEGVRRGLTVCGNILIPSLFPFMALSVFLAGTEYGRVLSRPLWPVTTRLLRLPGELGVVVLLSLIGGYPVGAKMVAALLEEGRVDRATAERMLCFCVNAGPPFVITAVGAGMFASAKTGMILFASQTAATLLIGFLVSRRAKSRERKRLPPLSADKAAVFVQAVNSAASGMFAMCAFAILFSGVLALANSFTDNTIVRGLLAGLLEVTAGSSAASRLGGLGGFVLTSCVLSFGGCSVLFQIMSCFRGLAISFRPFLLSRAAHMGLAAAIALPLYLLLGESAPVWLARTPPTLYATSGTALLSVCLLAMCAILTLNIPDKTQ
jgi:sporulation integral membrane protein YlbJ